MKTLRLFLTVFGGLVLTIGLTLIFFLFASTDRGVQAGDTIRYVAMTGSDTENACLDSGNPCATVQHAVDTANEGDEIRVAEGTYTGVFSHTIPEGYPLFSVQFLYQHVYLSKTLALKGGYTTTNWSISDPEANPTILDAQGQGRVIFIDSGVSPLIEGFQVIGGDATDLQGFLCCGGFIYSDVGGGIYVLSAYAELRNNLIANNVADSGAGVYFHQGSGVVETNIINANLAGGLEFYLSDNVSIIGNKITNNTDYGIRTAGNHMELLNNQVQSNQGNGVDIWYGDHITITANLAISNTSAGISVNANNVLISKNTISQNMYGGISIAGSNGVIKENIIQTNSTPNSGGGIWVGGQNMIIEGNYITDNFASFGGGIISAGNGPIFKNNVILNNTATTAGSGIYVLYKADFYHTTVVNNNGGDGSGIHVAAVDTGMGIVPGDLTITNTILISQTVGITVSTYSTATINGILWNSNGLNTSGEGGITLQNEYTGNPAFVSDGYHLMVNSAAVDKGVTTPITIDIDGEPRPFGNAPDLGADEYFVPTPPTTVEIIGASTGVINTPYAFTATVIPVSTTLPITYEWQATDQTTIVNTTGITNQVTYTWTTPGDKFISITASNITGTVSSVYTVTIIGIHPETIEVIGSLTGLPAVTYTFTATVTPVTTTLPITYSWQVDGQNPITHTNGTTDSVMFTWATSGAKIITVTVNNGFGTVSTTFTIEILTNETKIYLPIVTR